MLTGKSKAKQPNRANTSKVSSVSQASAQTQRVDSLPRLMAEGSQASAQTQRVFRQTHASVELRTAKEDKDFYPSE